jgi:hypothetical protein
VKIAYHSSLLSKVKHGRTGCTEKDRWRIQILNNREIYYFGYPGRNCKVTKTNI